MAKVQNTFLKSRMNKDLDARILPNGEYRDAQNAQISKSESANVGNLENILGNASIQNFQSLTGVSKLICIGNLADEVNNTVYLFFTDKDNSRSDYEPGYTPSGEQSNNFIISYNVLSGQATILVKGNFLNFSTENLITGVNILEDLLFFTDNRNQPRVINVSLANPSNLANPIYYTTEDQISVAKYNPYKSIELYEKSTLASTSSNTYYETTMKDVSSLSLPNGGTAKSTASQTSGNSSPLLIDNIKGQIFVGATVSLQNPNSKELNPTGATVTGLPNAAGTDVDLSADITVGNNQVIVFNPNPYFNFEFSGDPDYLEDRFVRFSYRFKYVDNEYSIFAPFTQHAFIPKQDGYFMYEQSPNTPKDDQTEAYQSTIVYFVENKINSIGLRIPLPFFSYTLENALKIKEIEILYKESDALAVKVIETIPISDITSSAAIAFINGAQPSPAGIIPAGTNINIDNIQGGIKVGETIQGDGIPVLTTITEFTPSGATNFTSGTIKLNNAIPAPGFADNTFLTIGDINYFTYNYESTKPAKTLPESELVRVYDKVPLKALAQEVAGNRVMYGNFVNKLTPPLALDYNVVCNDKSDFSVNEVTAAYIGPASSYAAGSNIAINTTKTFTPPAGLFAGMVISSNDPGVFIPVGTTVVSTTNNGQNISTSATSSAASTTTSIQLSFVDGSIPIGATITGSGVPGSTTVVSYNASTLTVIASAAVNIASGQDLSFVVSGTTSAVITLSNDVTFPSGTTTPVALIFDPGGDVINTTSIIEYPNSSVKTNRNYQVGFVLSDKYGRQSSVILSNSKSSITLFLETFSGSTLYSPYIDEIVNTITWPGDSLKVLLKSPIPGELYNGDTSSVNYNPLGWYSWKIVVKQTEQDYYNVYLPGIMNSYPNDTTLEVGTTSHTVLINDNINKIPRDLNEVGPDQRQFGSSVQLYGRVENTSEILDPGRGNLNNQYYATRSSDTATVVSTVYDLFDFDPLNPEAPNFFPQFYSLDSNPLVARITTERSIGQLATTEYFTESGKALKAESLYNSPTSPTPSVPANDAQPQNFVCITSFTGDLTSTGIGQYDLVSSNSLPDKTYVDTVSTIQAGYPAATGVISGLKITLVDKDNNTFSFIPVEEELITITETDGSGPPSSSNLRTPKIPGIQRLAVYETKPTESLLDIYWETSSSGLISDLNSVVLNNQSVPAGVDLFPFNSNNFDEGLPASSYILNNNTLAGGFQLINTFGQDITLNPNTFDNIRLLTVTNGLGQQIGGSIWNINTEVSGDYFRLVDSTGAIGGNTAPWNILATGPSDTTPALSFYNNIFFMFNEDGQNTNPLRNFTFTFELTIDDQVSIVTKEIFLRNVQPLYDKIEVFNSVGSNAEYGPGATPPTAVPAPPNSISVSSRRDTTSQIVALNIKNGANNGDLDDEDLEFIGNSDLPTPVGFPNLIFKQTIGTPDGPDAVIDGQPIFYMQQAQTNNNKRGSIQILPALVGQIQAALYFVTIRIQDAGSTFEDVIFAIDMRLILRGGAYDNNVALSGDVFNCALYIDFTGVSTFSGSGTMYRPNTLSGNTCGRPDNWWVNNHWNRIACTLLRVDATRPGVQASEAGYYLYAAGTFNNTYNDKRGNPGYAGSVSLCSIQNPTIVFNEGTVNIPLNTAGPDGFVVQKQTLLADNTVRSPLVKGTATVLNKTINTLTVEVEIDPASIQGTITGCMNAFITWPTNRQPPWTDNGRSELRGNFNPILSYNPSTGILIFGASNLSFNSALGNGVQLKFWGGSITDRNPWYFSPGTDNTSLARIQSYFQFSEWVMLNNWQNGGTVFGPTGYANPNLQGGTDITLGGMDPANEGLNPGEIISTTPDFESVDFINNIGFSIS